MDPYTHVHTHAHRHAHVHRNTCTGLAPSFKLGSSLVSTSPQWGTSPRCKCLLTKWTGARGASPGLSEPRPDCWGPEETDTACPPQTHWWQCGPCSPRQPPPHGHVGPGPGGPGTGSSEASGSSRPATGGACCSRRAGGHLGLWGAFAIPSRKARCRPGARLA